MKASIVLCALLVPTFAAAADNPPRLKAGEWQYVRVSDGGLRSDDLGKTCVADQSVLAKFDMIPNCIRKESHTDGTTTIADARCRVPYHAMSVHENVFRLDDNNFTSISV